MNLKNGRKLQELLQFLKKIGEGEQEKARVLHLDSVKITFLLVLCSIFVTPKSRGYENVTVMHIHRTKILSHIYAKHQYKQESEYESMWCIIHSNIRDNYKVIIGCEPILQG